MKNRINRKERKEHRDPGKAKGFFAISAFLVVNLLILLLLAGVGNASAEVPAGWNTNYTAALEAAKSQQQPLLVYFTASWCGPCRMMIRTTLADKTVVQTLTNVACVALDIDEQPKLAAQHGVRAIPTFKMLSPTGDEISSSTGYQDPQRFIGWLTNSLREVGEAAARQRQSEQKLAAAGQLLGEGSAESKAKTVAELLDLYAEQSSSVRESVSAKLSAVAETQPALLLDGLNHPRLAVRIYVANLLRSRLGDTFDFDPWSDAGSRQKLVARWREKLAAPMQGPEADP